MVGGSGVAAGGFGAGVLFPPSVGGGVVLPPGAGAGGGVLWLLPPALLLL